MPGPGIWQSFWQSLRKLPAKPGSGSGDLGAPRSGDIKQIWSGFPSKGLTPEKLTAILDNAANGEPYDQYELFEDMLEKDTELAGRYLDRLRPVANAPFVCQPGDPEDDRSVKAAEDAEEILQGLDRRFRKALMWLLDATGKGYAAVEIEWHTDLNGIHPVGFAWRHQKWFRPDRDTGSELRLLTNSDMYEGVPLKPGQFIVHTHTPFSGLLTRGGLFRPLSWVYLFRNMGALKPWVQLLELLGVPMRIGKYPRGTKPAEIDALEEAVASLGRDASAVIPQDMLVEIIETIKKGDGNYHRDLIDWGAEAYALLLLGQNLTSRSGDKGARSLGEVHWAVKQEIKEDDAVALEGTISEQLLAPWCMWNHGVEVAPPLFKLQVEEPADLAALSERDERLQRMGYPLTQRYIQEAYLLPDAREDDVVLEPKGAGKPSGFDLAPEVQAEIQRAVRKHNGDILQQVGVSGDLRSVVAEVLAEQTSRPQPSELDETPLIEAVTARTGEMYTPLRQAVRDVLAEAEDFEQARTALQQRIPSTNRAVLEDLLLRSMLAADLRAREASRNRDQVQAEVQFDEVPRLPNLGELKALAMRQGLTSSQYYGMEAEHRARAFTIGGVENLRVIEKVQDSLWRAEYDGSSFADWLDQVDEVFEANGITQLSTHRAELIFTNAVRQSQMAGRWAEEHSEEGIARAPYWLYDAVIDDNTTAFCQRMNGQVFRKDDAIWSYAFPPNHHRCRATVIELTEAYVRAQGMKVSSGDDIADMPDWSNAPGGGLGRVLHRYNDDDLAKAYGPLPGLGDPDELTGLLKEQDARVMHDSNVSTDQLRRGMVALTQQGVSGVVTTFRQGGLRAAPVVLEAERMQSFLDADPQLGADDAHRKALDYVLVALGRRLDDLVPGAAAASPATLISALYPEDEDGVRETLGVTSAPDHDLVELLRRAIAGGV